MRVILLSCLVGFFFIPFNVLAKDIVELKSEVVDQEVKIKVMMSEMKNPILGLGFYLDFDKDLLVYESFKSGGFLEGLELTPVYLVRDQEEGLVFGASLKKGDFLPMGSGSVVVFNFKIKKAGLANFKIRAPLISSLQKGKREDLLGVEWRGVEVYLNLIEKNPINKFNYWILISFTFLIVVFLVLVCKKNKRYLA